MLDIKVNHQGVVDSLTAIIENVQHRQPLMRTLAGTMHSAVSQNFQSGGRPRWLGLKYREGAPLDNTGNLKNSVQAVSDNAQAVVGTNEKYAPIHQFGGTITPKIKGFLAFQVAGKWVFTQKPIAIPARPFLQLTPQDENDLLSDAQAYFQGLVK